DTTAVSEQLTSIRNGYKLTTDEMERYLDTTALIAAETAADLEEMATAMSKVSSAANMMGVEYDQLNAILATVVSVTRQAPENVGTAFKTIFARLGDLKAAGVAVDESGFEVKLGQISTQLNEMGVSILDTNGDMRDMGDIVAEVGTKWDGWTQAQKLAAAQAMAGKRQYNNLVALFENWDMYSEQMTNAANAEGTLAQQNAIYLESVEAHLQKIQTAKERVYNAFFDTDAIKGAADVATGLMQTIAQLIEALGGGIPLLQGIGSALMYIFSNQIANGINKALISIKSIKQIADSTKQVVENVQNMHAGSVDFTKTGEDTYTNSAAGNMVGFAKDVSPYVNIMTSEQTQAYQSYLTQIKEVSQAYDDLKFKQQSLEQENTELTSTVKSLTFETAHYENELRDLLKAQEQSLAGADKTKERGIKNSAVYKEQELRIKELSNAIAENNRENKRIESQQGRVSRELKKTNIEITDQQTKIDQVKQAWQGFIKTLDTQALTQGFTKMASGAGQLAFAFSSLSNVGDIWSNENLSGGEKLLQTITALSFGIGSLVTGLKSVKEGYSVVSAALVKFVATTELTTVATAKETLASVVNGRSIKAETKEKLKAIFTNYTLADSVEEETKEQIKSAIARLLGTSATNKLTIAQAKEILTTALETKILQLNTGALAQNALATKGLAAAKTLLKLAASPVGLAIIVITAAVVAATAAMAAYEKRLIETNKATIESAKAFKEENKAILGQIDAYEKLNEAQEVGQENSEQIKTSALELATALKNQELQAYATSQNWNLYNAKLTEVKHSILETSSEMNEAALAAAEQNYQIEQSGGVWGKFFDILSRSGGGIAGIVAIVDTVVEFFKVADVFLAHMAIAWDGVSDSLREISEWFRNLFPPEFIAKLDKV
ncbi:MAG: phage tail tape measure protein, partial [Tenuifilaceae bacterium]|nr:phage tail tape measure protein [Tenuifilaceae bacterium]